MECNSEQIWNGEIDPSDTFERQRWIADLRIAVLRNYNVSVRDKALHTPGAAKSAYDIVAASWEYVEGTWDMKKFERECIKCLKRERSKLSALFEAGGRDRTMAGPDYIPSDQWKGVVNWWESPEGMEKREKMAKTRSKVTNLSRVGRGGIAAKQTSMVGTMLIEVNC
jgi:hypothetical protein